MRVIVTIVTAAMAMPLCWERKQERRKDRSVEADARRLVEESQWYAVYVGVGAAMRGENAKER